jgi:hypothetical protein
MKAATFPSLSSLPGVIRRAVCKTGSRAAIVAASGTGHDAHPPRLGSESHYEAYTAFSNAVYTPSARGSANGRICIKMVPVMRLLGSNQ